jgi:hypothetical protein
MCILKVEGTNDATFRFWKRASSTFQSFTSTIANAFFTSNQARCTHRLLAVMSNSLIQGVRRLDFTQRDLFSNALL